MLLSFPAMIDRTEAGLSTVKDPPAAAPVISKPWSHIAAPLSVGPWSFSAAAVLPDAVNGKTVTLLRSYEICGA